MLAAAYPDLLESVPSIYLDQNLVQAVVEVTRQLCSIWMDATIKCREGHRALDLASVCLFMSSEQGQGASERNTTKRRLLLSTLELETYLLCLLSPRSHAGGRAWANQAAPWEGLANCWPLGSYPPVA